MKLKVKILAICLMLLGITGIYFNASYRSVSVNPSYILRQTDQTIKSVVNSTAIKSNYLEHQLRGNISVDDVNSRLTAADIASRLDVRSNPISAINCMSPVDGTYSTSSGKLTGSDYNKLSCFYAMEMMTSTSGKSTVRTGAEVGWNVITGRWGEAIRDTKDEFDCKYSEEEEDDDDVKKWRIYFGWAITKINWDQSISPADLTHSNDLTVNTQRAANIDYSRVASDASCDRNLSFSNLNSDNLSSVCNNVNGVVDTTGSSISSFDPKRYQFFDISKFNLNLKYTTRVYVYCDKRVIEGCPSDLGSQLSGFTEDVNALNFTAANPSDYRVWYKDIKSTISSAEVEGHSLHEIASKNIRHMATYIENLKIPKSATNLQMTTSKRNAGKFPLVVKNHYRFCGSNYYNSSNFNRLRSTNASNFASDHFEHFAVNALEKILKAATRVSVKSLGFSYSNQYADIVNNETPMPVIHNGNPTVELVEYNDQHSSSTSVEAGNTQRYLHEIDNSKEGVQSCLPVSRLPQLVFTDDFYNSLKLKKGTLYQQGFNKSYLQEQMSYLFENKNICTLFQENSSLPCPITGDPVIDAVLCPVYYISSGTTVTPVPAKMYVDLNFDSIGYFDANWTGSGITDTASTGSLVAGSDGHDFVNGTHQGTYEATNIYPGIGLKSKFENLSNQQIRINFTLRSLNSNGAGFEFATGSAKMDFSMLYRFMLGQCDVRAMQLENIDWKSFEIIRLTLNPRIDPYIGDDMLDHPFLNFWLENILTNSKLEVDIKNAISKRFKAEYSLSIPFKSAGYIDSEVSNNGHTGIIHIKNMINAPRFAAGWECPEDDTDIPEQDVPEEDTPFETPELDVLK